MPKRAAAVLFVLAVTTSPVGAAPAQPPAAPAQTPAPPSAGDREVSESPDPEVQKYRQALARQREIARKFRGAKRGEQAQYRIGRLLVDPRNPERDYARASHEFQTLLRRYPRTRLRDEAQSWVTLLDEIVQARRENAELREDMKKLLEIDLEPQ